MDRRFYIAYFWSSYSLIYDFRSGSFAISRSLIAKFKFLRQRASVLKWPHTDTVRSCRLIRQAARSENKSKAKRSNKPALRFMLLHTGCFWYPTCSASSNALCTAVMDLLWTHRPGSVKNFNTKLNHTRQSKTPPFRIEVQSILKRSDKLLFHSYFSMMVWFSLPPPPPVPTSARCLSVYFFKWFDILGKLSCISESSLTQIIVLDAPILSFMPYLQKTTQQFIVIQHIRFYTADCKQVLRVLQTKALA